LFFINKTASNPEISEFLESLGLTNYLEVFITNGFDEMEVIKGSPDKTPP